jgi:hypothetical protein
MIAVVTVVTVVAVVARAFEAAGRWASASAGVLTEAAIWRWRGRVSISVSVLTVNTASIKLRQ